MKDQSQGQTLDCIQSLNPAGLLTSKAEGNKMGYKAFGFWFKNCFSCFSYTYSETTEFENLQLT